MNNIVCLDDRYSTTRCLTTEVPENIKDINYNSRVQLFLCKGMGHKDEGGLRTKGYFKQGYKEDDGKSYFYHETNQITHPINIKIDINNTEFSLITVITVVFNGVKYLEETIQSVINQNYNNVEYIIIDGGSTDGTLEIIKKYEHAIDYWVSERDAGIYDAMNKGIELSFGEWLYFLGGDDMLHDNSILGSISDEISIASNQCEIIFGKVISDSGKITTSRFDSKILLHNTLHHQSCFYRKIIFKYKQYDTSLKIISDYEINLLAYLNKCSFKQLSYIVATCRDGGVSTSRVNFLRYVSETNSVRKRHIKGIFEKILSFVFVVKVYLHYAIRYI